MGIPPREPGLPFMGAFLSWAAARLCRRDGDDEASGLLTGGTPNKEERTFADIEQMSADLNERVEALREQIDESYSIIATKQGAGDAAGARAEAARLKTLQQSMALFNTMHQQATAVMNAHMATKALKNVTEMSGMLSRAANVLKRSTAGSNAVGDVGLDVADRTEFIEEARIDVAEMLAETTGQEDEGYNEELNSIIADAVARKDTVSREYPPVPAHAPVGGALKKARKTEVPETPRGKEPKVKRQADPAPATNGATSRSDSAKLREAAALLV